MSGKFSPAANEALPLSELENENENEDGGGNATRAAIESALDEHH